MMKAAPRILCVDDDPANLQLLEAMLTPRGYKVLQARSGKETHLDSVKILAGAINAKDPYTRGHSDRVRKWSVPMARGADHA